MNRNEIETELGIELPKEFESYDDQLKDNVVKYLKSLNTIEKKAYMIGKHHLGSTFNLIRSNGFVTWKNSQK
jgi:hypothetical protein